jgi:hypothetical protein
MSVNSKPGGKGTIPVPPYPEEVSVSISTQGRVTVLQPISLAALWKAVDTLVAMVDETAAEISIMPYKETADDGK